MNGEASVLRCRGSLAAAAKAPPRAQPARRDSEASSRAVGGARHTPLPPRRLAQAALAMARCSRPRGQHVLLASRLRRRSALLAACPRGHVLGWSFAMEGAAAPPLDTFRLSWLLLLGRSSSCCSPAGILPRAARRRLPVRAEAGEVRRGARALGAGEGH
jgi:hypothetical protein